MFSLKIYRNGFKKSEFNNLDMATAMDMVKQLHLNNRDNMPSYYITEEGSNEVLFSNTDFKEIDNIKTVGGVKMKNKLLNRLMAEFNEYESKKIKENALKESLKDYSTEFINNKITEAKATNKALQGELLNKVSYLKDEAVKELRSKLADEMLNSKVADITKLVNAPGVKYTKEELQSLYDKCLENKDALSTRFLRDYALNNEISLNGKPLTTIEEKIEAVNQACEYTTNYIDRPEEMALIQEQVFSNFDSILE